MLLLFALLFFCSVKANNWVSYFQPPPELLSNDGYTLDSVNQFSLKIDAILKRNKTSTDDIKVLKSFYEKILSKNYFYEILEATDDTNCKLTATEIPMYTIISSTNFLNFLKEQLKIGNYSNLWNYYLYLTETQYTIFKNSLESEEIVFSIMTPFSSVSDLIMIAAEYDKTGLEKNTIWSSNSTLITRNNCIIAELFSNDVEEISKMESIEKSIITISSELENTLSRSSAKKELEFQNIGYYTGSVINTIPLNNFYLFNSTDSEIKNKPLSIVANLDKEYCPRLLLSIYRNPNKEPEFIQESQFGRCLPNNISCGVLPELISLTKEGQTVYNKLNKEIINTNLKTEEIYISESSSEILFEIELSNSLDSTEYKIMLYPSYNYIEVINNEKSDSTKITFKNFDYSSLSCGYAISSLCSVSRDSSSKQFSGSTRINNIVLINKPYKTTKIGGTEFKKNLQTTSTSKRSITKIINVAKENNYNAKIYFGIILDGIKLLFGAKSYLTYVDLSETNLEAKMQKNISIRSALYFIFSVIMLVTIILVFSIKRCKLSKESKKINKELKNTPYSTSIMSFAYANRNNVSGPTGTGRKELLKQKTAVNAEIIAWDRWSPVINSKVKLFIRAAGVSVTLDKTNKKTVIKTRVRKNNRNLSKSNKSLTSPSIRMLQEIPAVSSVKRDQSSLTK